MGKFSIIFYGQEIFTVKAARKRPLRRREGFYFSAAILLASWEIADTWMQPTGNNVAIYESY